MGAAFAEPVQTVTHEDGLEVVDISVRGDGNVVAVGYANGGVSLYARGASVQWDTHKRKELPTPGLDAGVTHRHAPVCFAPDGSFLATGHHGSIVVWPRASSIDYANERAVRLDLKGAGADGGRVSETAASLAVAQVGEAQFIAAGLVHSAVCIWSRGRDADTFAQVSKQTLVASGPGPVTSVSFSVDGKFLAAAHNMHLVLFQRASHGTWHLRFTSKGGLMVRAVAFSRVPGATTLAVAWRTGVVGLLHVTDRGDEAPSVRSYQSLTPGAGHAHDDDLYCVDVARNGKAIVAGGQGRTLVWTLGETGNMNCDAAFELRGKPLAGASMRAVAFHGDRFAMSACAWGRAPVCVYDMAAAGSLPDPTVFVCNDIPASAEAALPYVLKAFPRSGEPGDGATLVTPIVRQVRSFASAFDEARAHLKSTPSPQMIIIFHNQQDPKRGEITTRGSLFRDTWPKVEELREWWANETDGIFSRRRKYELEDLLEGNPELRASADVPERLGVLSLDTLRADTEPTGGDDTSASAALGASSVAGASGSGSAAERYSAAELIKWLRLHYDNVSQCIPEIKEKAALRTFTRVSIEDSTAMSAGADSGAGAGAGAAAGAGAGASPAAGAAADVSSDVSSGGSGDVGAVHSSSAAPRDAKTPGVVAPSVLVGGGGGTSAEDSHAEAADGAAASMDTFS